LHQQLRRILAGGLPDSLILVGGQAALYYVDRYREDEPFLDRFTVITSRDSDFLGTSADVEWLASRLGAPVHRSARKGGFLGLSLARIHPEPENETEEAHFVEILGSVLGARQTDVERTAMRVQWPDGGTFRIIHPVILMETKAANLVSLDQADRNDRAHLGIACLAARASFRGMNREPEQGRNLVTLANRVLDLAESNLGRALLADHDLDLTLALPDDLQPNHPSLGNWLLQGLPRRQARIQELAQNEGLRLGTPLEEVFSGWFRE
jgi:hypothetical protein